MDLGRLGRILLPAAGALVLGLAIAVAVALLRRGPRRRAGGPATSVPAGPGADELDRAADRAAHAGDHRAAVVLRFRGGALHLLRSGALDPGHAATSGQVAREGGDPRLGPLAAGFDRAAYGAEPVDRRDADAARDGWRSVLARRSSPGGDGSAADAGPPRGHEQERPR